MGLGPSTPAIMLRLVLVSLAAASAMETKEQLMKELSKWNNDVACWGMENMMKFELSKMQAVEECGHHGLASSMVRPTNPFNTLPGNLGNGFSANSNPFNTLPGNLNNGFSSSSRNPLANLLQRNNIKNSAKQTWKNLWGDFLGGRSKRATAGLLEYDEEAETEKFIRDFDDFKHDMASNLANLTCVLTKLNMLDSSLQVNLKAWTNDMGADGPEPDGGRPGLGLEEQDGPGLHRLLPDRLQLARGVPQQEPCHQGVRPPHDLLQVRHEKREEELHEGPDVQVVDLPLW